jgi:hypothetical protein
VGDGTEDEEPLSRDSDEWAGIAMSEKETTFTGTDGGKEKDSDYVPEQPAVSGELSSCSIGHLLISTQLDVTSPLIYVQLGSTLGRLKSLSA